jgi:glycosyltransferase involved in cell wall biosynthesis
VRALVLSHVFAEPASRRKVRELAALGWSVVVAIPRGTAGMDGPVRVAPIPASGNAAEPAGLRWPGRAIRRLLTDVRPDLVHIEEEPGSPAADVATREAARLGIPSVVFSWRSLPAERSLFERRRFTRTMARVAGVIGGNRLAEDLLAAAAPGVPTLALPQAGVVPPAAVTREGHDGLTLAYVGRLVPERGADRLLRACGQLMGGWTLTIAGTGPEQEALEEIAQKLGLASRLRWLGALSRDEVSALWPGTDVLVVPSRSTATWVEAWSPVLLDAMAAGVAPVVSAEGALPEVVGDAGCVFADEEELLVRLQELVSVPEHRAALGEAARRRVLDRYLDASLARATDAFWREVLARRPAAAAAQ